MWKSSFSASSLMFKKSAHRELPAYLPWIDVLRFFACFLVIILHACPAMPMAMGHAGVALFFSISGFLICRGLLGHQPLSTFYARRFLRIYPAYVAAVLLFWILSSTRFIHDAGLGSLFRHNLFYYLTFTFQLSPDRHVLPFVIVWSLCVEELFYLFIPVIFLVRKPAIIALALSLIAAILLIPRLFLLPDGSGTWFLFPLNLFSGALLAVARPCLRSFPPVIGVVAVALIAGNIYGGWFHSFGPVSAILCAAAVWSFASYDRPPARFIAPLLWMGRLSYGMYLLHLFCISFAIRCLGLITGSTVLHAFLLVVLTTGLAAAAAWCLKTVIEEPALRLRPTLNRSPGLRYFLGAFQVSFIPIGVFLALLRYRKH